MPEVLNMLLETRHAEVWDRCCGFIDLNVQQFMDIQRRRLMEQIRLLAGCELGKRIMGGGAPWTVDEFRASVPLTRYADYAGCLLECRDDALPEAPYLWQRTTGRGGAPEQWVPVTRRLYQELGDILVAILLLSTASDRGEVAFELPVRILYGLAPPPYASGTWGRRALDEEIFDFLPPLAEAEKLSFEEALRQGFYLGLSHGIDYVFSTYSVLVALADRFGEASGSGSTRRLLRSQPGIIPRLAWATLKSKLARRPMVPRDAFSIKGLAAIGADAAVYREKIREKWGRYPLDVYGRTEASVIAVQTWDYQTLTFLPNLNFLEFIPERERLRSAQDPSHRPRTVLLDEVRPGENYELVITNFLGGPFIRYRIGDVVSIAATRNEMLNIDIPQIGFVARADNLIDIAGFTRLTEDTLVRAIERAGIAPAGWTARKELADEPLLHMYLELQGLNGHTAASIASVLHNALRDTDPDYADLERMLGLRPLRVTILPAGSFARCATVGSRSSAEGSSGIVPHLNPSDEQVRSLLALGSLPQPASG